MDKCAGSIVFFLLTFDLRVKLVDLSLAVGEVLLVFGDASFLKSVNVFVQLLVFDFQVVTALLLNQNLVRKLDERDLGCVLLAWLPIHQAEDGNDAVVAHREDLRVVEA